MKKNIIFSVFIVLVVLNIFPFTSNAEVESSNPTLSVTGFGESKAKPDVATLNLSVTTKGKTAGEAGASNSASTQKLIDALLRAGIAEKDIQTSNISITPLYKQSQPSGDDDFKIVGYQAINELQAKIRKIGDVGRIIDIVVFTGNYTIQGVSFGLEKDDDFQAEALRKAVSDARRQADIVANAAGKSITGVKSINVGGGGNINELIAGSKSADFATPILPGELTISANVSIQYFLDK